MAHYTSVTIIYNPNSTGPSESLASELKQTLAEIMPGQTVDLVPTKHAGHGESLAYDLAMATKRALVISASGDGGYHDVVNGLMKAQIDGATPIGGLLPAGNANDHYHSLHSQPLSQAIKTRDIQKIDLLHLTGVVDNELHERYAHSYIGIGLTPKVGAELNKTKLNWFNEIGIVLRVLFLLQPVKVIVDNRRQVYDSLIFSNIEKMSKVLQLSDEAKVDDGKFEVTAFHRRNKLALIAALIKASTTGLAGAIQTSRFEFETLKPVLVQLDGEITTLDKNSKVRIKLEHATLECII